MAIYTFYTVNENSFPISTFRYESAVVVRLKRYYRYIYYGNTFTYFDGTFNYRA